MCRDWTKTDVNETEDVDDYYNAVYNDNYDYVLMSDGVASEQVKKFFFTSATKKQQTIKNNSEEEDDEEDDNNELVDKNDKDDSLEVYIPEVRNFLYNINIKSKSLFVRFVIVKKKKHLTHSLLLLFSYKCRRN